MVKKEKNKIKPENKSKILVLGIILIAFVGLFSFVPIKKAHAQTTGNLSNGTANTGTLSNGTVDQGTLSNGTANTGTLSNGTVDQGTLSNGTANTGTTESPNDPGDCVVNDSTVRSTRSECDTQGGHFNADPKNTDNNTAFQDYVKSHGCGLGWTDSSSIYPGCFIEATYGLFYVIPAFLLFVSAYFFNVLISVTLSGALFANSTFIPSAWGVVRDLSNLFFILILLYIAIKMILGLGGHDLKKMIGTVIIMALLINFSMFFTEVVIDSSNILALIFYNKMQVNQLDANGNIRQYESATGEKDVAGRLVNAFDPTRILTSDFFGTAATETIPGVPSAGNTAATEPGAGIIIGITIIAGVLMFFAAYCLVVAGLSFVGRMIELFMIIIFSPFAFMSFSIPELKKVSSIGWDKWSESLLSVSFMAPIFMFFLYFIFLLIGANIFGNMVSTANQGFIEKLLLVILPAVVILILLLKATDYAKKGSGKFGEYVMKGAQMVGGLALGAATGGTALAGTSLIGGHYQRIANDDELRRKAAGGEGVTDKEQRDAQRKLATANSMASKSFDFRQTGIGKFAIKKSGLDLETGTGALGLGTEKLKGGAAASYKREIEKNEAIRKSYEMTPETAEKQDKKAAQYKEDLGKAKKIWEKDEDNKKNGIEFDEDAFRKNYERAGQDLSSYGLYKKSEGGSVRSSKEINDNRREAQAWHMEHPTSGQDETGKEIKTGLKDFGRLWKEGIKEMVDSKSGLAKTTMIGGAFAPFTAGASFVAAPFIGGALHAIKTIAKAEILDNAPKDSKIHRMIVGDPNLAGTLRKGTSASQKIVDILKGIESADKREAKEIKHAVASIPTSTPPPTGNSGSSGNTHTK